MEEEVVNYFTSSNIERENSGKTVLYIPNDQVYFQELSRLLKEQKNIVINEGLHVKIVNELINQWIDDNYTELLFTDDLEVRKVYKNKHPLYIKLSDQGSGVQKVIITALYIALYRPKLILIDDIEAATHPSLLKEFINGYPLETVK